LVKELEMDLFYRPDRLRKVGLYLTDLLTQLEGLQFTIQASDLRKHLPQAISKNLGSTIKEMSDTIFTIEASAERPYLSEYEAEKLIAKSQELKRQTKKAYIDLGKYRSIPDQNLSALLDEVNDTIKQVPLSRQGKRIRFWECLEDLVSRLLVTIFPVHIVRQILQSLLDRISLWENKERY